MNTLTATPNTWLETLDSGERILIRPLHVGDVEMERRFIEGLSPDSRRFRFLETMRTPSDALLRQLMTINPLTDVAYVAVLDDGAHDHEVGVGRFCASSGSQDCEFALAVSDEWQNKGIGTLLMGHLVHAATALGLRKMYSSDAADNDLMRRLALRLHMDHHRDPEDATQVVYSVSLRQNLL